MMAKKSLQKLIVLLIPIVLMTGASCSKLSQATSSTTIDDSKNILSKGKISIVSIFETPTPQGITTQKKIQVVDSGVIRLQRGSGDSAIVKYVNLNISNSVATASVSELLVGNWVMDVQLYDKEGTVIYSGNTKFTLNANDDLAIVVSLVKISGDFILKFEVPSEDSDDKNLKWK